MARHKRKFFLGPLLKSLPITVLKDNYKLRHVSDPLWAILRECWTCLTEITCDIFVCVVGVWQRDFLDLWCVCAWCVAPGTHTPQVKKITLPNTDYAHKNIASNFSQARSALPEDGPQRIRNMSEFVIVF